MAKAGDKVLAEDEARLTQLGMARCRMGGGLSTIECPFWAMVYVGPALKRGSRRGGHIFDNQIASILSDVPEGKPKGTGALFFLGPLLRLGTQVSFSASNLKHVIE